MPLNSFKSVLFKLIVIVNVLIQFVNKFKTQPRVFVLLIHLEVLKYKSFDCVQFSLTLLQVNFKASEFVWINFISETLCNHYMVGSLNNLVLNPNVNVQNPGLSKDARTVCQANTTATSLNYICIILKVIGLNFKGHLIKLLRKEGFLGYIRYSLRCCSAITSLTL